MYINVQKRKYELAALLEFFADAYPELTIIQAEGGKLSFENRGFEFGHLRAFASSSSSLCIQLMPGQEADGALFGMAVDGIQDAYRNSRSGDPINFDRLFAIMKQAGNLGGLLSRALETYAPVKAESSKKNSRCEANERGEKDWHYPAIRFHIDHPEKTLTEIAKHVGKSVSLLSKDKPFRKRLKHALLTFAPDRTKTSVE